MDEGFTTFDHTGDLGLEVWAQSPERLHALAVEALFAQIVEIRGDRESPDASRVRVRLDLVADDPHDLLVHWLNRALLHGEIERAAWVCARIDALTLRTLTGWI